MIAQCSTCGKTFDVQQTGAGYCPHCGTHVFIESDAAEPGRPVPEHGGEELPGGNPFDRRHETGFLGAFLGALKLVLFEPGRLFRNMRIDSTGGAFLFGWLCLTIGSVANGFWNYLSARFSTTAARELDLSGLPREIGEVLEEILQEAADPSGALMTIVLAPIVAVVAVLLNAALVHVGTILFGANNRGWNASFTAVCYGFAPWLLWIIPVCGGLIGTIWTVILTIVGVYYLQRTTGARATFAVMIWYIVCCFCVCGGAVLIGGVLMGTAGAMAGG